MLFWDKNILIKMILIVLFVISFSNDACHSWDLKAPAGETRVTSLTFLNKFHYKNYHFLSIAYSIRRKESIQSWE